MEDERLIEEVYKYKFIYDKGDAKPGRVVSGLEFGRWKHKTETNRLKTVRVGSGRVVSVLVETRPNSVERLHQGTCIRIYCNN